MKTINERIKAFREQIGLSQPEFASTANVSIGSIWNIENGEVKPSPKTIRAIEAAFNINPEWLRTGKGDVLLAEKKNNITAESVNPWKEEAYATLKQANESLEKKYQDLLSMFNKFMDKVELGKHNALNLAALSMSDSVLGATAQA